MRKKKYHPRAPQEHFIKWQKCFYKVPHCHFLNFHFLEVGEFQLLKQKNKKCFKFCLLSFCTIPSIQIFIELGLGNDASSIFIYFRILAHCGVDYYMTWFYRIKNWFLQNERNCCDEATGWCWFWLYGFKFEKIKHPLIISHTKQTMFTFFETKQLTIGFCGWHDGRGSCP